MHTVIDEPPFNLSAGFSIAILRIPSGVSAYMPPCISFLWRNYMIQVCCHKPGGLEIWNLKAVRHDLGIDDKFTDKAIVAPPTEIHRASQE